MIPLIYVSSWLPNKSYPTLLPYILFIYTLPCSSKDLTQLYSIVKPQVDSFKLKEKLGRGSASGPPQAHIIAAPGEQKWLDLSEHQPQPPRGTSFHNLASQSSTSSAATSFNPQ